MSNQSSPEPPRPRSNSPRSSRHVGPETIVRATFVTATGFIAALIALVTTLVAAEAPTAAMVAVVAIIAVVVGSLAIAAIYVWKALT